MSTFLSPAQAAQVTQVSRRTITRAITAQALRATRDNKNQWRIRPEDLEAWRSAQPAHWAPTEQAQEDAQPAHLDAHSDAHPAQESAHAYKALQDEVETLRQDLAMTMARVVAAESELRREREERARERADWERERETILEREGETVADLRSTVMRLLTALEKPVERPVGMVGDTTSAKPSRGLLARLMGR